MTLHVFAICYNEEYLMPFFLQHYYSHVGATHITIYDNYSTDGTEKVIQDFSERYPDCKVSVIKYDSEGKIRDDLYIQIKNTCWKDCGADWVVICDMDEFLYFENPIQEMLQYLSDNKYDIVRCKGYEMVGEKLYAPEFEGYDGRRLTELCPYGTPRDNHNKCLLFKGDLPYINYGFGAHGAYTKADTYESDGDIKMLHYKFLSLPYLIDTYRKRAERLSDFNKQNGFGFHYTYTTEQITNEYNDFYNRRTKVI